MISCKKATHLISKSMEEKLSFKEELSLKVHLFICEFCEQFKKQVGLFRNALNQEDRQKDDLDSFGIQESDISISEEAKKRIKDRLNK